MGSPEAQPLPVTTKRLSAVLRWRARWLKHQLPQAEANALRFLPALLQASFPSGDLRGEPPGIEKTSVRRSWGSLARFFDLPPPNARQRGRRLICAVFALQSKKILEVHILPAPQLGNAERQRLEARLATIENMLRLRNVAVKPIILDSEMLDHREDPLLRIVTFGALIAGEIPSTFWPEGLTDQTVGPETLAKIVEMAPTPFSMLCALLMAGAPVPLPSEGLRRALETHRSSVLADPEIFSAFWSSTATDEQTSQLLFSTLTATSKVPRTRQIANEKAGRTAEQSSAFSTAEVIKLGRRLSLACVSAVRRAPAETQEHLRPWLRQEIISRSIPSMLFELFSKSFRQMESHRRGPILQIKKRGRRIFEACDASGACLGRGATAEQAQLRAIALLAAAFGETPANDDSVWRALGERLAKPVGQRTLFLAVEPAAASGSPHDPLNRGPDRIIGFSDTLSVLMRPGGRPSARRLSPEQVVERIMIESARGTTVEAFATSGEAQPASARLMRAANLCRKAGPLSAPLAIEAGGNVFLLEPQRTRRFSLKKFAARPRQCTPDAEAPDLTPFAEDNLGRSPFAGNRMVITCQAMRIGEDLAGVLFVDPQGYQMHEEVPLTVLEQYLADTQIVLRGPPSPMMLAVRFSKELDGILGRYGLAGNEAKVNIEIHGSLPFGLQVSCLGERFGAGLPLGWPAAAQAVLSAWPSGVHGIICAKTVTVDLMNRPAVGLARLYARSAALRRLTLHVGKACRG